MLNDLSKYFKQIGDISTDIYFVFNIDLNGFEYISPAFVTVCDLPVESVMNSPERLIDLIHPEDRSYVSERYTKAQEYNGESRFEFRLLRADEQVKHINLSLYPLASQDGGARIFAGVAHDVTILQRNIYYAEKINARKNSTLEILAHDLRGPIGIVNMMASSIHRDARLAGNDNIIQAVDVIQALCKRNIDLIRELLKKEYLESPGVFLRKERADLVWGIKDVIKNYERASDTLHRQFIVDSSHDKLYVQIDSLKFIQAFNNLISNAIKFTPTNGVIHIGIQDGHEMVRVTVRDNGIGIPQDLQPYLFDKFTRARRVGLAGEETTGLGMSIIKTIIELHGGKIWFESLEGVGTTFYIEIPKN